MKKYIPLLVPHRKHRPRKMETRLRKWTKKEVLTRSTGACEDMSKCVMYCPNCARYSAHIDRIAFGTKHNRLTVMT